MRILKRFINEQRKKYYEHKEFDAIVVTEKYVFLIEVKTTIRDTHIAKLREFIDNNRLFNYFPDLTGKTVIPVMASIDFRPHNIDDLSEANILALSVQGDCNLRT